MSRGYSLGVIVRAVGAGALALASKVTAVAKGAGGASGVAKGLGGLAVGGGAAAVTVATSKENKPAGERRQ